MIEAPDPGLYTDVPPDVYHSWSAVSASLLADLRAFPPAQVRYNMTHPRTSRALELGGLFHTALLEPNVLDSRYIVSPRFNRTYTDKAKAIAAGYDGGKHEAREFEEEARTSGKIIADRGDFSTACAMRDAVYAHPMARQLLEAPGGVNEASLVWIDPGTGLKCKLRVDRFVSLLGLSFVIDLKSSENPALAAFGRAIENLSYHVRAAWYLRGLNVAAPASREFVWIVVGKNPPHLPAVYTPDPDDLAEGHAECDRLLNVLAHCLKTDTWPGHTAEDQPEVCVRPRWARRQTEVDVTRSEDVATETPYTEESW